MQQERERWHAFHFSGKVIMCSVLFGLGLVLVGGLVMAIGTDQKSDSTPDNLDEIQYRAPMVIVGPVLMGIGALTVITGIIMCLFETNICRKRKLDSKSLIEDQVSDAEIKRSSPKLAKHRNHKNSRKHAKNSQGKFSVEGSCSTSSKPIDVQNSESLTTRDNFVTPSSSFVPDKASKSWVSSDTSTEFQTPSSSFQNSFEAVIEHDSDKVLPPTSAERTTNFAN